MTTAVPLVPREVLFGNPERTAPSLSPDGQRLAWLAPDEGVLNVFVGGADLSDARPVTADRDRGIRTVAWAHDGRHLLYIQDRGGDENWRLHAVDLSADLGAGADRDLTPFDDVQALVVGMDKRFPDDVLVGLNKDRPELHDVYRLHLPTGELTKVLHNPGFVAFVADRDLAVRAGAAPTPDGGMAIMVRDDVAADWHPLLEVGHDDALVTVPLAFSGDGRHLLALSSQGANASRLLRLDCGSGDIEVLAEDERYDVADVRLDPDTHAVHWVSVAAVGAIKRAACASASTTGRSMRRSPTTWRSWTGRSMARCRCWVRIIPTGHGSWPTGGTTGRPGSTCTTAMRGR